MTTVIYKELSVDDCLHSTFAAESIYQLEANFFLTYSLLAKEEEEENIISAV
jgi:hypothetical protein